MFRESPIHGAENQVPNLENNQRTQQHLKKMRTENIFDETTTMSEEHTSGHGPQANNGLSHDQQLRFQTLMGYADELEKEINRLIAQFEQNHKVSCWVSTVKHNQISIAIAAEKDNL